MIALRLRHLLALAITALQLGTVSLAQTSQLRLFSDGEEGVISSFSNGKWTGVSIDLLNTTLNRNGIPFEIFVVPWKRALETARTEDGACAFTTVRTEEREKSFKWIGPLEFNTLGVYALDGNKTTIAAVEDLRKHRVGGMVGEAITDMLLAKGIHVDSLSGLDADSRNMERLKLGRIDLWVRTSIQAAQTAAKHPEIKIKQVFAIQRLGNYLACNLNVSDTLVNKVNATLEHMARDGTTKAIFRSYGLTP